VICGRIFIDMKKRMTCMRIELELWKVECTEFESSTKNTPNFVFQFFNRKPTNSASKPINSPATKRFSTNKETHVSNEADKL
jgi:hypothetical protein